MHQVFLLALLMLVSTTAAAASRLEVKEDRFTGETTIKYESPHQANRVPKLLLVAMDESPVLALMKIAPRWQYLRCKTVYWIADDQRFAMEIADHDGEPFFEGVIETVATIPTDEQWVALAGANSIDYRICNDEFKVTADDLVGIREFVAAVQQHRAKKP